MPFLNRRHIASSARREADKAYKAQLRRALGNPGLTTAERENLKARLAQVGGPRVYDAASPPPPGAIALPAQEPAAPAEAELKGMKKAELQALAAERGLPTSGTKAVLVERLLSR